MIWEYLLFNVIVLCSPVLVGRLYPGFKWPPFKQWLSVWPVALCFWLWDAAVTNWWWDFNPLYITGLRIGPLPIEEILFFITVPTACLLLWMQLRPITLQPLKVSPRWWTISLGLLGLSLIAALNSWWYTASVVGLLALVVWLDLVFTQLVLRKSFLIFLFLVTLFTLIFNGYLTARPIVRYNLAVKSNLMIGSVPMEDVIYGWILVILVLMLAEQTGRPNKKGVAAPST